MEISKRNGMTIAWTILLTLAHLLPCPATALAAKSAEFETTKKLALHEDAAAQNRLGAMYAKGQGVAQDYAQAFIWYQKAAEQGHAEAEYNLGAMYHLGEGVRLDYTQAIMWYHKSAGQGHEAALSNLEKIRNHIASLTTSAEQGQKEAQVALGDLYANGNGVPRDYDQAVSLYRKAAGQNDAAAQCRLGDMFGEGKGVARNDTQAVVWYRKAIAQDHAEAKYKLGGMYHRGRGVPKDNIHAYAWISLAADQGDSNAMGNKEFAASLLSPDELKQARELAADLNIQRRPQAQ